MKKVKLFAITGLVATLACFATAAQSRAGSQAIFLNVSALNTEVGKDNTMSIPTAADSKAQKDFTTRFAYEPNVKWLRGKQVITASFVRDSISYRVVYNKGGYWIRNMKEY